jgi:hypothetical protein
VMTGLHVFGHGPGREWAASSADYTCEAEAALKRFADAGNEPGQEHGSTVEPVPLTPPEQ